MNDSLAAASNWVPSDYDIRSTAVHNAVASGSKDVVKTAQEIYTFLTAGNASVSTSKPETKTEKPAKADAPKTEPTAKEPSSDKPASTEAATTATSPSEAASGFAESGEEITLADIRAAAVKFVSANDDKALMAKLSEFGSPNLSGLDASKYGEFLAALATPVASEGVFD